MLNKLKISILEKELIEKDETLVERSIYSVNYNENIANFNLYGDIIIEETDLLLYILETYENYYKKTVGYGEFIEITNVKNDEVSLNKYKELTSNAILFNKLFSESDIKIIKSFFN